MLGDVCAKSIAVSALPECRAREVFGQLVGDPNKAEIWVVAKEGGVGDWAAYYGWPDINDLIDQSSLDQRWYAGEQRSIEQVMSHGDKLEQSAAEELFPGWKHLVYRR